MGIVYEDDSTPEADGDADGDAATREAIEAKAREEADAKAALEATKRLPAAKLPSDELAPWMLLPPGWKAPKGRQLVFVRFPAEWTDTPEKGVEIGGEDGLWRLAIITALSLADKRIALERSMQKPERVGDDLCRQMLRCVDGLAADWSGARTPGSVEIWYNEIGEKCRAELQRIYMNLHQLDAEERTRFFTNCIEVRSAG
jgi:hypothetical protein